MDSLSVLRDVAQELRHIDQVAYKAARDIAPVERDLTRARLRARARVLDADPKLRIPDVEMRVELDEHVEALRDKHTELSWQLKAAKESAHSLRQILSAFQSTGRIEADMARYA